MIKTKLFWGLGFMLAVQSPNTYAYLDPGTGSMIIQGIVGGIAALMATGAIYWQRIKSFFSRSDKESTNNEATNNEQGASNEGGES